MDTILNLTIVQSSEEKGRHTLITRVSDLKKSETHLYYVCLLSQEKGNMRHGRVFLLLNCIKIDWQQKILHMTFIESHTCARFDTCSVQRGKSCMEHKLFSIFEAF
jgi:hypothetical protein